MVTIESIDLNLLLVLHHVLEQRSVSRAAERLHVTPAAVSNSLARLRGLLRDPLVVRNGRGLALTPVATELTGQLSAVIGGLRRIVEGGQTFDPTSCRRRFTIASADNINPEVLPRIIRGCAAALPGAVFSIVSLDQAVLTDALATGEVDVLLGIPPQSPGLKTARAYSEELVCVADANAYRHRKLSLDQFLGRRHIAVVLQGRHPLDGVDAALAKHGQQRDIALTVPLFTTAAACVAGTSYFAMLPARMAAQLRGPFALRVLPSPVDLPTVQIQLAWHERSDRDEASSFFRSAVLRELKAAPERRTGRAHPRPHVSFA